MERRLLFGPAGFIAIMLAGACHSRPLRSDGAAPDGGAGLGGGGIGGGGGSGGSGPGGGAGTGTGRGGAGGSGGGAGAACDPPPPGIPDGGVRCPSLCDPARPDGGVCYGVPGYNAANVSMQIWVEDTSAPTGGWRITLPSPGAATVGGHTYEDRGEGLVGGGGNGVYGDLFVARDGQDKWTGFHFEGFAAYQGNGVWDWPATLTVSRSGAASPVTIGRHYIITRQTACGATGTYNFVADDPPRACALGVDLLFFALGT